MHSVWNNKIIIRSLSHPPSSVQFADQSDSHSGRWVRLFAHPRAAAVRGAGRGQEDRASQVQLLYVRVRLGSGQAGDAARLHRAHCAHLFARHRRPADRLQCHRHRLGPAQWGWHPTHSPARGEQNPARRMEAGVFNDSNAILFSLCLRQVSVPIVSNDRCKAMFLRAGRHEFIPEIFLCAGHETGGQDSCQGDSGGPLQV